MNKWITLTTITFILLTGCTTDARKEAQAYQIRSEADQAAITAEQQRAQADEAHAIYMEQLKLEQQHRTATAAQWEAGLNTMITWAFRIGTIALCIVIIGIGRGAHQAALGIGEAASKKAMLAAHLIPIDTQTGQYPALLQYNGSGKYTLTDINAGITLQLDTRNKAEAQMVAGAIAIRQSYVLATAAARSDDNGQSIAAIRPEVVQPVIVDIDELNRVKAVQDA